MGYPRSQNCGIKFRWFLLKYWGLSGAEACKSCRSRQELSNEYLFAKFGVDAGENEPCKVCSFGCEKSGKGSISNLSTKVHTDRGPSRHLRPSNERKRGRMSCKQNRNVIHLFLFSLFFRTALFCFPPPNGQRSSRPDFTGTTRVLNFSSQRSGKKTCEHVSMWVLVCD